MMNSSCECWREWALGRLWRSGEPPTEAVISLTRSLLHWYLIEVWDVSFQVSFDILNSVFSIFWNDPDCFLGGIDFFYLYKPPIPINLTPPPLTFKSCNDKLVCYETIKVTTKLPCMSFMKNVLPVNTDPNNPIYK